MAEEGAGALEEEEEEEEGEEEVAETQILPQGRDQTVANLNMILTRMRSPKGGRPEVVKRQQRRRQQRRQDLEDWTVEQR